MSSSKPLIFFSFILFMISYISFHCTPATALITDVGFDWASSSSAISMVYSDDDFVDNQLNNLDEENVISKRRSLYWNRVYYTYISYAALSANRVPCPPRSGRSYYTHNCFKARGPANPYHRGCSCITRCRR
ncbi:protein RALF-like 34 [Amaranthus tricolor]|uniref:protein RALF-like 34 n=1 Tax=Amaranthus tricolor TaxID=29722 RepID=UPI0025880BC9|nr:protein RALF-like 34 [Amaranthus tricolor]